MRILITGSSGMLGQGLSGTLGPDHELTGIDIVKPVFDAARDKETKGREAFYNADVTDLREVRKIFNGRKPELVIHGAAWTDVDGCEVNPDRAYKVNVEGTRNVAEISRERDAAVIFISTDFVFDGGKNEPYKETDIARPLGVYGRTKYLAERILEDTAGRYAVVRTSWLYGKGGRNFVDGILEKSKTGRKLQVVDDQVGSPTYVKDLAQAIKRLLGTWQAKEIYHVSGSGQCSWYDFALRVLDEAKKKEAVVVEPISSSELARPALRPKYSVLDNSKFEKAAGYVMRPWEEALDEYLHGT